MKKYLFYQDRIRLPAQAIVEMVLLLPILLILVLGAMDFGRLFTTKIVLTNAAREGVNYLSENPDDQGNCDVNGVCYLETISVIQEEANNSGVTIDTGDVTVNSCCTPGNPVEVVIVRPAGLILGNVLQALGIINAPVTLTSKVEMVVQ